MYGGNAAINANRQRISLVKYFNPINLLPELRGGNIHRFRFGKLLLGFNRLTRRERGKFNQNVVFALLNLSRELYFHH